MAWSDLPWGTDTLIYTTLGRSFTLYEYYPEAPQDKAFIIPFLKRVPGLVSAGLVKANPVKLWEGGLEAVNDGLQFMREGKNSGEKIVYKLVTEA